MSLQLLIMELTTRTIGMINFSVLLITEDAPENLHGKNIYYRELDIFVGVNDIVF